jgi:hypothetical protein
MKKIKSFIIATGFVALVISGTAGLSLTQTSPVFAGPCKSGASIVGIPPWYDNLCMPGPDGKDVIQSPKTLASGNDTSGVGKFATIVAMNIVTILLYVVGYVSLAFIIWGGFKYMISGDSSNGTSAAKTTILNAVIGLVLSIMSVAIVKFIAGAIVK